MEKKTCEVKPPKKATEKEKMKKSKKKEKKNKKIEEEEEEDIDTIATRLFGDKIHYVSTHLETAKKLREMGYIPVVDGIIAGVTGGLLAQAPLTDQEVTALLAHTSTLFPDPDPAIAVLKVLSLLLPKTDIARCAEEMEKEGSSLKKMMQGILQSIKSEISRKSSGVPYGMYQ